MSQKRHDSNESGIKNEIKFNTALFQFSAATDMILFSLDISCKGIFSGVTEPIIGQCINNVLEKGSLPIPSPKTQPIETL